MSLKFMPMGTHGLPQPMSTFVLDISAIRAVKYSSTLPAPEVLVLGRSSTQFEYSTEFSAICCEKAELAIALPGLQCHLLVTIEKQKFFHDFPRQYSFISGLENHSKKSYFCLF